MNRIAYSILLICLLIGFDKYTIHGVVNPDNTNLKIIKNYSEDLTGNGVKDVIELKGTSFSSNSKYYRDIKAFILSADNKQWEIPYLGGYDPSITFIDLNHDNINDILFQSATEGNEESYQYYLHTINKNKLVEIPLPNQSYVLGKFKDNYTVEVTISPNSEPIIIDIQNRKEDYIQLGMYSKEGVLIKNTSAIVNPVALLEPKFISNNKGYGLKSYQKISGANHTDILGTIESLWYYDQDKWILLQSKWIPSK